MNQFTRKNKSIEKLRGIFFQIGLIIAGGLTLVAFEWTSPINPYELPDTDVIYEDEWEMPPILPEKEIEKPDVKYTEAPKKSDLFKVVLEIPEPKPEPTPEPTPEPMPEPEPWEPYEEPEPTEPEIFTIVEKMPEFVGGNRARLKYLSENVKYPRADKQMGMEGTVHLQFVINKKGEIKNIEILRGVSPTIDAEAIRVLKEMPKWKAGKQRGKPVSVKFHMPIKFELR